MGLQANVVWDENGKYTVDIPETSQKEEERKPGAELGKEDFLLLLVTQMQYQDPLDPADNTQFVTQLAQFSELEQMSNLNATMSNTSAYTLVGKEVLIRQTSSAGEMQEFQGRVQYVTIKNGDAYVSVDGTEYAYDNVVQVLDDSYLISQYIPSVAEQHKEFSHQDPQDLVIEGVKLGSNGYQATSFAVVLVDGAGETQAIDPKYLSYKEGTLTIDREALLNKVEGGNYLVSFVFDDANKTVDCENVTLTVKGIIHKEDNGGSSGGDSSSGEGSTTGGTGSTEGSGTTGETGSTEGSGTAGGTGSTEGSATAGGTGSAAGSGTV